tara:strand:+ start:3585 stop:4172 length:588 start_codon:yes stop_codon:yes gene_type:complete
LDSVGKIEDCKLRINKLVPKDVCDYFIKLFEENEKEALPESSYKFKEDKIKQDNFKCINLTRLQHVDNYYKKPHDIARNYIAIMIANYVAHIRKNICPTFNDLLLQKTDNIRILRYRVGERIEDHSDVGGTIRGSCTLNLNEDYEGGEFTFFNGRIKEVFKTGDCMIFPAEPIWIHGTEPVTKGVRYSINCFLYP